MLRLWHTTSFTHWRKCFLKKIGGRGSVDPCRSGPETNYRRLRGQQVTRNQKVTGQISRLLQRIINIVVGDSRRGTIGKLFRQKKKQRTGIKCKRKYKNSKRSNSKQKEWPNHNLAPQNTDASSRIESTPKLNLLTNYNRNNLLSDTILPRPSPKICRVDWDISFEILGD